MRLWKREKLFCEMNPLFYAISERKEILKRHINNLRSKEKFAGTIQKEKLANLVSEHSSNLIKRGKGIDISLQEGKAINIKLACSKINGIIIHPGEVFSFWKLVGKDDQKKGIPEWACHHRRQDKTGTGRGTV